MDLQSFILLLTLFPQEKYISLSQLDLKIEHKDTFYKHEKPIPIVAVQLTKYGPTDR